MVDDLDLSGVLATAEPATVKEEVAVARQAAQRRGRQPLIFDLETVPDESRLELFGLDPLPTPRQFTPAGQLPDPATLVSKKVDEIKKACDGLWPTTEWILLAIAAEKGIEKPRKGVLDEFSSMRTSLESEAGEILKAQADRNKLLSVTPEFCRIVAIGTARGDGPIKTAVVGQELPWSDGKARPITEMHLLESFWEVAAESGPCVGFNCIFFDLPVIFIRSALLGVRPSRKFDLRPWGGEVIDLMTVRWPKGGQKPLKDLARILGITVPAEGVDGSHVGKLFAAGKLDEIAAYQSSDIDVTRQLFNFYRGFWY